MTNKIIQTAIDILGRQYPIRCQETEVNDLQEAAKYLNEEMERVKESGKAINLERIAIITALNISYQFLKQNRQRGDLIEKIHDRIEKIQDKLTTAIYEPLQTDMLTLPEAE